MSTTHAHGKSGEIEENWRVPHGAPQASPD
jgi:hypothetical protein